MTKLVLAAHGSRDPRFAVTVERIATAVGEQLAGVDVRLAYLDLNSPTVQQVLADCEGDVVVAPLLLSAAFHSKVDLPAIIDDACATNPAINVRQLPTLGSDPRLIGALADRLDEVGLRPTDGVLFTAVGSSDDAADGGVHQRAAELATALGNPLVQTVFATRLGADNGNLRAAVRRLRRGGARRIVVSPLLSVGRPVDRTRRRRRRCARPGAQSPDPLAHIRSWWMSCATATARLFTLWSDRTPFSTRVHRTDASDRERYCARRSAPGGRGSSLGDVRRLGH